MARIHPLETQDHNRKCRLCNGVKNCIGNILWIAFVVLLCVITL